MNLGVALDGVNRDGYTAMECAVRGKKKNNVEYLLSLGAPVGDSLFVTAARIYAIKFLTIFVNHGIALDGVNSDGDTAVECAIRGKKKGNLEYLLNLGAPIGKNSLFYAAKNTDVDVLTILANHGIALDGVNHDGYTAVECAIRRRKKENAEYLMGLGAPLGKTAFPRATFWKLRRNNFRRWADSSSNGSSIGSSSDSSSSHEEVRTSSSSDSSSSDEESE